MSTCVIDDCERSQGRTRGMCTMHYARWLRLQHDPTYKPKLNRPIRERVDERIIRDSSGCWLWDGHLGRNGYGSIHVDRRPRYAHRVVWELERGPIPAGLTLDHLCRVRRCVNPDHLEPVSSAENIRRAFERRETDGLGMPESQAIKFATEAAIAAVPRVSRVQADTIARTAIQEYVRARREKK